MARSRETKIELTAYDDLFETDQSREEAALSKIRDIPIAEIDEFPDHPFKVLMDEDIFDNYYILETILTSPYSQMEEFDENGDPVFADETRSEKDIKVFAQAQAGITDYFEEYMRLVPESARIENKMLGEKMLALINRIQIKDEDFMALQVEDPFFGRVTAIADVIG